MQSTVEVRAAAAAEYPAAAQLRQEMSLELGTDYDAQSPRWRTLFCAYFSGKQAAGTGEIFLAFEAGTPVACATVTIVNDYRSYCFGTRIAYINAVYVRPELRRQGIAMRLMQQVVEWARERGCVRVRLRASDDGRFLYEKIGFRSGREMELELT